MRTFLRNVFTGLVLVVIILVVGIGVGLGLRFCFENPVYPVFGVIAVGAVMGLHALGKSFHEAERADDSKRS